MEIGLILGIILHAILALRTPGCLALLLTSALNIKMPC